MCFFVAVKFGRMSKKQREKVEDEVRFHRAQMRAQSDSAPDSSVFEQQTPSSSDQLHHPYNGGSVSRNISLINTSLTWVNFRFHNNWETRKLIYDITKRMIIYDKKFSNYLIYNIFSVIVQLCHKLLWSYRTITLIRSRKFIIIRNVVCGLHLNITTNIFFY